MSEELEKRTARLLEYFEQHFKTSHYLLLANGTGFVGCLAAVKDYASIPNSKGLGLIIALFCTGLLAAIGGYMGFLQAREAECYSPIDKRKEPWELTTPSLKSAFISCAISALFFIAAVTIIVVKVIPL